MKYIRNYKNLLVVCFFIVLFLLGIFIFRDYGLSWDEPVSRNNGLMVFRYVVYGERNLFEYTDRDYGTAFEFLPATFEAAFKITNPQIIYQLRHFLTFLLFFMALIVFYKLCRDYFSSVFIGFLAAFFLVLSPRIFADSFYNSKDIPVLSLFIISAYTLLRFFQKPSTASAVLHAAVSAFLIDIRLIGLFVPLFTVIFVFFDFLFIPAKRKDWEESIWFLQKYLFFLLLFVVLFWPFLWEDPAGHFLEAFKGMGQFQRWGGTTLFLGEYIKAAEVPWYYIPVWLGITTPLIYILFFIPGLIVVFRRLFSRPASGAIQRYRANILFMMWLFVPWLAALFIKPELYDGWRHFYFIYPAFIIFGLAGLVYIRSFAATKLRGNFKKFFLVSIVTVFLWNMSEVVYFMVRHHPYQNLYFNTLAGNMQKAKENFEMDYWGLSYKEGLEYILKIDESDRIPIFITQWSSQGIYAAVKEGWRFTLLDNPDEVKYVLSNYRWQKENFPASYREIYSVKIDETKIMSVFKIGE